MAKPPQVDVNEVYLALESLDRRVAYLEQTFIDEEEDLQDRDSLCAGQQKNIDAYLALVRAQMKEIRSSIDSMSDEFAKMAIILKQVVKKDEIERLSARVDRLDFEKLVTKRSLAKELEEMQWVSDGQRRRLEQMQQDADAKEKADADGYADE